MSNEKEEENYYSKYWKNWLFKAARANEIIKNLETKPEGGDLLFSFNRWFKTLINTKDNK